MHGDGTYTWNDGRVYNGEWSDDKMHGKGIFTWPDGRIYDGFFENDQIIDQSKTATITLPDESQYKGSSSNGFLS